MVGGISYGILKYLTDDIRQDIKAEFHPYSPAKFLGAKRDANFKFQEYFKGARGKLDVIGITLSNFFIIDISPQTLIQKISNGCHVRLACLHPNSIILAFRALDGRQPEDYYIDCYRKFKDELDTIAKLLREGDKSLQNCPGKVEVFLLHSLPYFSYFRADNEMIAGFYNRDLACTISGCLEISKPNAYFDHFSNDFESAISQKNGAQRILLFSGGNVPSYEWKSMPLPEVGFTKMINDLSNQTRELI